MPGRSDSIFWDTHSGRTISRRTGREYIGYSPSKKSVSRIKEKVGEHLAPAIVSPWEEVRDRLNQKLRGWQAVLRTGEYARRRIGWSMSMSMTVCGTF